MARVKPSSASSASASVKGKALKVKKGGLPRRKIETLKKPLSTGGSDGNDGKIRKRRSDKEKEKKEKKTRKFKASTVAKRECKLYQTGKKKIDLLFQKRPFQMLVREIMQDTFYLDDLRIQGLALNIIQDGIESFMHDIVRDAIPLLDIGKRKSITAEILRESAKHYFNKTLPSSAAEKKAEEEAEANSSGKKTKKNSSK